MPGGGRSSGRRGTNTCGGRTDAGSRTQGKRSAHGGGPWGAWNRVDIVVALVRNMEVLEWGFLLLLLLLYVAWESCCYSVVAWNRVDDVVVVALLRSMGVLEWS